MRLFRNGYIKLAIAGVLILALAGAYSMSNRLTMSVEAVTATAAQPVANSGNPASSAGSVAANTTSQPKSAPACQPGNAAQPATPHAEAADPDLHKNIQTPVYYTVYGNSVDEINNQMAHCTPVGEGNDRFAASTDYSLNWAFDFQPGSDGMCHVSTASVSINIALTFPRWQPTAGAPGSLNNSWQRYITNLTTHENGHVNIDQNGAAQLLTNIQNFPAANCDMIVAQVTAMADNTIQTMNQANDDYDTSTDHGATQGAMLK